MFFNLLHFCCVGKKIVSVSHIMQDTSLVKHQVLASLFRSYSSTDTLQILCFKPLQLMENTFELWFCYKQSQEKCNCLTPGFLCFKWNKMIFSDILKIIVIFAVDDGTGLRYE